MSDNRAVEASEAEVRETEVELSLAEKWDTLFSELGVEEATRSLEERRSLRYIHERKPKLRWWRRRLGRWGR